MNTHNAEIANGTYTADIGTTTLKAFCNDNNGFAIYAAGYTGNEIGGTNSNKLVGTSASNNATIETGLATTAGNPDTSNWAMKLALTGDSGDTTGTNAATIDSAPNVLNGEAASFSSYHVVPNEYTKVSHKNSATSMDTTTGGVTLTTTYAAYISKTQIADTYSGQVIYTLVHSADEAPSHSQITAANKIGYYPNTATIVDTMADQEITAEDTEVMLWPSNFRRPGYGFAGWNTAFDMSGTNYGPMEDISFTAGEYSEENGGLSLYANWIKSAGIMQGWTGCSGMAQGQITALTDSRDGNTYAIAKLADNNCWMIENLRLADKSTTNLNNDVILNITNTNNPSLPLNNSWYYSNQQGALTTSNRLSSTSDPAQTTPIDTSWCIENSSDCINQSMLSTNNTTMSGITANSMTSPINANIYSYGNYYNWYSATAGNGTQDMIGVDTNGDLCPAGWHLPTGTGSGDFGLLSNNLGGRKDADDIAQNMNSSTIPTGAEISKVFRSYPNNFLYSGYISAASVARRGSNGGYWTSTASNSNDTARGLNLTNSAVSPGVITGLKYRGFPIRCLKN